MVVPRADKLTFFLSWLPDEIDLWRFHEQLALTRKLTNIHKVLMDKDQREAIKERGGRNAVLRQMLGEQQWPSSFELGFRLSEFAGLNAPKCKVSFEPIDGGREDRTCAHEMSWPHLTCFATLNEIVCAWTKRCAGNVFETSSAVAFAEGIFELCAAGSTATNNDSSLQTRR